MLWIESSTQFKTIGYVLLIIILTYQWFYISMKNYEKNVMNSARKDFKAFITSSYYYPTSKSLGDNSFALVILINHKMPHSYPFNTPWYIATKQSEIIVEARNRTNTLIVRTNYSSLHPEDEKCNMIAVFATVQLLPNPISISLVGDNGRVGIPFQTISSNTKHDVVVCISPLFMNEQWQNFLFAVHNYKKFGAFVNLYLISSVDSLYYLMKEYEKQNYLTIQPWISAKFIGVPPNIADPHNQVQFRNQAGAQTDCLLKYKETASYVTFLDLDDVLIPRLAPTYFEEFNFLSRNISGNFLLFYNKRNYDVSVVRDSEKFSVSKMFGALKNSSFHEKTEIGKIVVNPRMLNYTWIHGPPITPNGFQWIRVDNNDITHLKKIEWVDDFPNQTFPSSFDEISIDDIEKDWNTMKNNSQVIKNLPKDDFYTQITAKCYHEKYYKSVYSRGFKNTECFGPQLCEYPQREDIKCIHADATYKTVPNLEPISYFYATNPRFSSHLGCHPN